MARWTNKKDFKRDLKNSYSLSSVKGVPRGRAIGSIIRDFEEHSDRRAPPKGEIGLAVLDDLISDVVLWYFLFLGKLFLDQDDFQKSYGKYAKAVIPLAMRITQDAVVIRKLISDGFDVQARNLLRSLDEHIDAMLYLSLNPKVAEEFVETNDEETSNKFWYKHIRGAGKVIDAQLSSLLSVELKQIREFKLSERRMLNSAHHPSYWACTVPYLTPTRRDTFAQYISGTRSEFSYRPAKYLFFSLCELAALLNFLVPKVRDVIKNTDPNDGVFGFISSGFDHLMRMTHLLVENWNAPVFADSPQLKKFMDTLPKN